MPARPPATLFPYTTLFRSSLDALRDLNELQAHQLNHPETQTRIAQYEMAFRMQAAISYWRSEEHTSELPSRLHHVCPLPPEQKNNCHLPRRTLLDGVRFRL